MTTVRIDEYTVDVGEQGTVTWKGRVIGRAYKGTRTYSPPTHKGSRIARYHKQVPCWWAGSFMGPNTQFDTRRDAILWLIRRSRNDQAPQ